jgi:hypothetical protein
MRVLTGESLNVDWGSVGRSDGFYETWMYNDHTMQRTKSTPLVDLFEHTALSTVRIYTALEARRVSTLRAVQSLRTVGGACRSFALLVRLRYLSCALHANGATSSNSTHRLAIVNGLVSTWIPRPWKEHLLENCQQYLALSDE